MATKLLELWIIDKAGLALIHIQDEKDSETQQGINPILFSGFLTAVESIAAESIEAIKMKDSKILILPVQDPAKIFVVGRAKIKEKDDNIRKLLFKVAEMFLAEFREIIIGWAGDHDIFDYYTEVLKEVVL